MANGSRGDRAIPGRRTQQRDAVIEVLRSSERFRSAQDVYDVLRASGQNVGLTTVYRHLQSLVDQGVAHTLQTENRTVAYRWCGASEGHHHHLVCRQCGMGTEIAGSAMESWIAASAAELGYTDVSHTVEVFGLCPACRP